MPQSVPFEGWLKQPVIAVFDQPASSSDAGALLLRAADERLGLTSALAGCLADARAAGKVKHSLLDVVRQRVYGLACGYEDCNDAARLRHDPVHKLLLSRHPLAGAALASQPTLSRFEREPSRSSLLRLGLTLLDVLIARHRERLGDGVKLITIDVDGTEDETYGQQPFSFYNAFYGGFCYQPLLAFVQFDQEAEQYEVASLLRPGNCHPRAVAIPLLKRLLPRLRTAFPQATLRVRLDGGFAAPDTFTYLEMEGVEFVVAMADNKVLSRLAEPLMHAARAASQVSGESERRYGHASYRAKSWSRSRRVVFKAEVVRFENRAARDNARFVITNLTLEPEAVYQGVYAKRGDAENRIKELKLNLVSGRTSSSSFQANQFRLILTSAAYALYQELRLQAAGTPCAHWQVATLRERLIKLGGWITSSSRRILLHLPRQAPWRYEWSLLARRLRAQTT